MAGAHVWRDRPGHAIELEPWHRWYYLKRWRRLRMATFVRDGMTCQMEGCGRLIGDTSQLVADHRVPHRGDPRLFWDPDNVWTLCKACHDQRKQAEEHRGYHTDVGLDGLPTDPRHPWNAA